MAGDAPTLTGKELKQWKLIADFRARLERELEGQGQHPSWEHPNRTFQQADYLSLFLMALVNPVVKTLRAVSEASGVERVQEEVGCPYISLGSLSEAQHLVQPEFLDKLLASLRAESKNPCPRTHIRPGKFGWHATVRSLVRRPGCFGRNTERANPESPTTRSAFTFPSICGRRNLRKWR